MFLHQKFFRQTPNFCQIRFVESSATFSVAWIKFFQYSESGIKCHFLWTSGGQSGYPQHIPGKLHMTKEILIFVKIYSLFRASFKIFYKPIVKWLGYNARLKGL